MRLRKVSTSMGDVFETLPEIKLDGVTIHVEKVYDTHSEPDNLGELGLCPEGAIDRQTGEILDESGNPVQQYDELKTFTHGDYRYWKPANHWPHNPKDWEGVDEKTTAKIIEDYGSFRDADITYAIQDFLRHAAWMREEWHYYGLQLSVRIEDRTLFQRAVFGLESDMDSGDQSQIQDDMLREIRAGVLDKHKTKIEQMLDDLVVLEQAFPESA